MAARRIGIFASAFLIACAVIVDVLQFLIGLIAFIPVPAVGIVAGVASFALSWSATPFFGIAFWHISGHILQRNTGRFIVTIVVENTPVLNALPVWTPFVIFTVLRERASSASSQQSEGGAAQGAV